MSSNSSKEDVLFLTRSLTGITFWKCLKTKMGSNQGQSKHVICSSKSKNGPRSDYFEFNTNTNIVQMTESNSKSKPIPWIAFFEFNTNTNITKIIESNSKPKPILHIVSHLNFEDVLFYFWVSLKSIAGTKCFLCSTTESCWYWLFSSIDVKN